MPAITTVTKIPKTLKPILTCNVFGKVNVRIKARGLFQYMGFTFITTKDGKDWYCYEFTSGYATMRFCKSEHEVISETKRKIDAYAKSASSLRSMIRTGIVRDGFSSQAKYSNLLPKSIHILN